MEKIKKYLQPVAHRCGLPLSKIILRRILKKQSVFILMYHRVDYRSWPFFETVVNPGVFEKQIRFLKSHYQIINLSDLKKAECAQNSNRDIVVLTFDDGYYDNYAYAFPILKKYEIPATIFLTTDFINTKRLIWYDKLAWILNKARSEPHPSALAKLDIPQKIAESIQRFFSVNPSNQFHILQSLSPLFKKLPAPRRDNILNGLALICNRNGKPVINERAMLSWQEIREMARERINFGAHTVTHPVLADLSEDQVKWEIIESKKIIENKTQRSVNTFAYPFGKTYDYSDKVIKILKSAGIEYACTAVKGHEKLPLKDCFNLKRRGASLTPYLNY